MTQSGGSFRTGVRAPAVSGSARTCGIGFTTNNGGRRAAGGGLSTDYQRVNAVSGTVVTDGNGLFTQCLSELTPCKAAVANGLGIVTDGSGTFTGCF